MGPGGRVRLGKGIQFHGHSAVYADVHKCARMQHALTIAKLPGSDLAAIQFLNRSLEELGIIKVEAGAQDGNLFGRLLVKVATYMLKPGPARPWLRRGCFRWRGGGRCDLRIADTHFFQEALCSDLEFPRFRGHLILWETWRIRCQEQDELIHPSFASS